MALHVDFAGSAATRQQARDRALLRFRLVFFGGGILVLAAVALLSLLSGQQAERTLALATAREQFAADAWRTREIERQLGHAAGDLRLATSSEAHLTAWRDLLTDIRDRLPAGVWLTSLEIAPAGAGDRTVRLAGKGRDHEQIGQFLAALDQSPKLTNVVWRETRPAAGDDEPDEDEALGDLDGTVWEVQAELSGAFPAVATGGDQL